jgi:hypothetical protein
MEMQGWLTGMAGALAVVNLGISVAIVLSHGYTARQKTAQVILVWALPVLGSIVFGLFLWTQRGNEPPSRELSDAPDHTHALWEAAKPVERQRD